MKIKNKKIWKTAVLYIAAFALSSFNYSSNGFLENTKWVVNCLKFGNDTVFIHSDSMYTYRYNYYMNKSNLNGRQDSLKVNDMASKRISDLKSMKIVFDSESTFLMTKMRSGGKLESNEMDSGTYTIHSDTVKMTIFTRRDYKLEFKLNKAQNKLFSSGASPVGNVYLEYVKVKE